MSYGKTSQQVVDFYKEAIRRIDALPGVSKTAFGNVVPWRDGGGPAAPGLQFSADGHVHAAGVEDPRAQWRVISPGFFPSLGVPIIAGRDFNALDGQNNDDQNNNGQGNKNEEPVVIVSQALAQRMFPIRMRSIGMSIGPIPCCNSWTGPNSKRRVCRAAPHHRRHGGY